MGELSTKEKAKRYDEALQRTRKWYDSNTNEGFREIFEDIFPELLESEGERIRKELIAWLKNIEGQTLPIDRYNAALAWLEKQGEHAKFRDSIQVGDKVTRNEDGVLVNLSQLNRVAKKKGEQKPIKEHNVCKFCEDRYGCVSPCPMKLIEEQEPAWSEEDEEIVEALNDYVKNLDILFSEIKIGDKDILSKEFREKVQLWLKSLRPQSHWKPSGEQIKTLWDAIVFVEGCNSNFKGSGSVLEKLYNDLKKLREE